MQDSPTCRRRISASGRRRRRSANSSTARSAYFRAVVQDTGNLVSQGFDVLSHDATVLAYAAAYVELLKNLSARAERETGADELHTIVSLRKALAVDTIRLVVEDYRGQHREAALIAPTHPLRALRHLVWVKLGAAWVRAATTTAIEHVTPARDALAAWALVNQLSCGAASERR